KTSTGFTRKGKCFRSYSIRYCLLNQKIAFSVQQLELAISWHLQLQFLRSNQLIQKHKTALINVKTAFAEQEHALKIEQQVLAERKIGLETTENTVAGLTTLIDKALLKKEAAEVALNNLVLEQQNIETTLERKAQNIQRLQAERQHLHQKLQAESALQLLQTTRIAELTAQIDTQKKLRQLESTSV
ncbi:MAG: hypothetical protein SVR94_18805, partial [Pseudomonadota bacterium]|nr:hypothetical protein [Pseudomonadota bacterium]